MGEIVAIKEEGAAYVPKPFDHLLGAPGFSDQLLKNHVALYQGYVTNVNKLAEVLAAMAKTGKVETLQKYITI